MARHFILFFNGIKDIVFVAAMEEVLEVAIIGGGLGGLALAAGLHARGIKAHVFEKSSSLRSDTATAVSLATNASTALDGIIGGLSDEFKSMSSLTKTLKFINVSAEGQETTRVGSQELYVIKWRTARSILAQHVPSGFVHCSHTLLSYSSVGDGKVVLLEFGTGQGGQTKRIQAGLVIGADGINSAVRNSMVGDEPRDLHLLDFNALVHNPQNVINAHDQDQICVIQKGPTLGFLVDAGEDHTLWLLRVEDTGSGSKTGVFGTSLTKQRVLHEIDKLQGTSFHSLMRKAVEATESEMIFERRCRDRLPVNSWSDLDHKVVLIGDAAHAMHSGPGEGARTAFEDAHQLCELVSSAFAAGGAAEDLKKAVLRFEEMRIPRMTKFQSFAAESTCIPEFIPEWAKKLSPAEKAQRMNEFQRWVSSYPNNMSGDPSSTFFK